MPSGKTLVTVANADKSFELHLDAGSCDKATLGTSAKTGGPICRVLDAEGTALATLVFKVLLRTIYLERLLSPPRARAPRRHLNNPARYLNTTPRVATKTRSTV